MGCTRLEIIDDNASVSHQCGRDLELVSIVGSDGRNETSGQIHVLGQHRQLGRCASHADVGVLRGGTGAGC